MERIVHIAVDFQDAEQWDIQQQLAMTPDERLEAAHQLICRHYGTDLPDVRDSHRR